MLYRHQNLWTWDYFPELPEHQDFQNIVFHITRFLL